jgi:uncharacterized ion transporter superfamily protein YfcC
MSHLKAWLSNRTKKQMGINAFSLLFGIIIFTALLSYILPAGSYERIDVDGRKVIVPESFQFTKTDPIDFFDIFNSIHTGMVDASSIIFYVLIVGGAFGIIMATGAIDAFISMLAQKLSNKEKLIIPIFILFFGAAGALMAMAEETLVYIGILIPISLALGFDRIVGLAMVSVGASVGFTAAIMNPFTVGVAQGIAELPTFSGMGFRIVLFIALYIVAVIYVYRYAGKVKKDPSIGFYGDNNLSKNEATSIDLNTKMEARHKWVLLVFLLNFIVLVFGVTKYGWFLTEIAGLFLFFSIIIGLVGGQSPNDIADHFVKGAGNLIGGALIIGFAQAILVLLNSAGLMDTILYYSSAAIDSLPSAFTTIGMFFLQMFLNFFIPSGSGQAALTMPIMAPLSDLVGITRQTAVLAFQLGDGISNMIFPTSGFFMAGLALAGIPWGRWIKWIFPFILIEITIAIVALMIAQWIHYGPF